MLSYDYLRFSHKFTRYLGHTLEISSGYYQDLYRLSFIEKLMKRNSYYFRTENSYPAIMQGWDKVRSGDLHLYIACMGLLTIVFVFRCSYTIGWGVPVYTRRISDFSVV